MTQIGEGQARRMDPFSKPAGRAKKQRLPTTRPPPEGFRLGDFADLLAGFIRALGLERPHTAGMSFGGALVLALYRRHPALVRTLIVASGYAGWVGSLPAEESTGVCNRC
jgi:pimeloyl-ACP methyl ester carboxylesterase